jgi:hypothetical protein
MNSNQEPDAPFDDGESGLVTIHAFGHRFVNYPSGLAEDLITLEAEGAVYAHFADAAKGPDEDGLWDFHYYRISLTPAEIVQHVEASLAYNQFCNAIDAGATDLEAGLAAVSDQRIADRVRRYDGVQQLGNGETIDIRGCLASFYPDGMEALLCGGRRDRYEVLPETAEDRDRLAQLMQILNNFALVARLLRDRGHRRPDYVIENEYDVQDLLFALVRSTFEDATREEWTPKRAGSAKRIDMVIPSVDAVIEAKYVRDNRHATRVADELRVDFECYHDRPECKRLLALVVDPHRHIIDPVQFGHDLSGLRQKREHSFDVTVLVR